MMTSSLESSVPGEVAFRQGFLSDDNQTSRAKALEKSGYGNYLLQLLQENPENLVSEVIGC